MSAPLLVTSMAHDMAREIVDNDYFELNVGVSIDGVHACGEVIEVTRDGLDFLERWLKQAYEAGRRAA
jgi:hypothetical protein